MRPLYVRVTYVSKLIFVLHYVKSFCGINIFKKLHSTKDKIIFVLHTFGYVLPLENRPKTEPFSISTKEEYKTSNNDNTFNLLQNYVRCIKLN